MAEILMIGNPSLAAEFATLLRPEHSWSMLDVDVDRDVHLTMSTDEFRSASGSADAIFDLTIGDATVKRRALLSAAEAAGEATVIFANALTCSATNAAVMTGRGVNIAGVSIVPALTAASASLEMSLPLQSSEPQTNIAIDLLRSTVSKDVLVVEDRVGLVSARILAMVINEAVFAMMEGVADASSIDTAMKLGTGYPEGPLRWADAIGPDVIVSILDALHAEYAEERYRACVLLRQHAAARRTFHPTVPDISRSKSFPNLSQS